MFVPGLLDRQSVTSATSIYFASYYLQIPEQANYFVLLAIGSAVLSVPLCVWLAEMDDRKHLWRYRILVPGAEDVSHAPTVMAVDYGVHPVWSRDRNGGRHPLVDVPDVVEQEQQRPASREGAYYAFISFFQS